MKQTHGYLLLRRLALWLPLIAWVLPARGGELYHLVSGLDPAHRLKELPEMTQAMSCAQKQFDRPCLGSNRLAL